MTDTAIGRRGLMALAAGGLAAPHVANAQAAWPNRPITLVVGFPPGGQTDFAARVVQNGLQAALGQPVAIDNRGGAGGNLGTEAVLRARPDGYTLLAGNASPMAINPHTMGPLAFDPLQMTPIGMMLQSSLILCVHPSVPARNVREFIDWVRPQGGRVNYGSASAGSLSHTAMELLRMRAAPLQMEHVPYRGSGPAMQDFIAGRFSAMFDGASVVAPFLQSGQLRGILATGANRSPAFPDIQTSAEQGLQDFTFTAWIGLYGPPGLPPEIVARANAALNQALADPATRERMTSRGDEPGGGTPQQLADITRRDHATWGQVVRNANIRAE
ncbi:Bug family tripartite tricarboxylate transporter substrate binding protein [Falsiroseomonas oryziterrae]|uniref:Bug family tripartite tricarboxylate transporter substrate binding protein n=1 Tax=Falsiroseomonas oryziterrae TaxID=2911368 RepID=UPI001F245CDD|nr:tripartite tricarboxylate transporter substrate binding protein [Roseomonas sp. NPKOSM-4]